MTDRHGHSLVGTRLGGYLVLAPLGAGGMGEVYRARDSRLGRDVALKLLPREFTADPTRLARLEREARALAALNHPHIAAIYGIEDIERAGQPAIRALILELVEGQTLAERMNSPTRSSRGLPIVDTLAIAKQIADALDAAHEKGIIHRDLKPSNIKVTPDGVVKVLDFGLAKLARDDEPTDEGVSGLSTMTAAATQAGIIVGTAAYMSPEQARGQAIDKRTDIWAFGCVLYEMLTGRTAFGRETTTDTLAAILEREPDWSLVPADTPIALRRVLVRALQKDLRRRSRDIGDVRGQLDDVAAPAGEASVRQAGGMPIAGLAAAAVGLVVITASAVLWWSASRSAPVASREPIRYSIVTRPGEELPIDAGLPVPIAISSDGRHVAFTVRGPRGNQLYVRRSVAIDPVPIAGTEGAIGPFFSPDGEWIGFASGGVLRKVPLTGGSPQTIADVPNLIGATWTANDTIVFNRWQSALFKVSARGGTPETLTTLDTARDERTHRSPHALSSGSTVLFVVERDGAPSQIEAVDVATGARRTLIEGLHPQVVHGRLLFVRGSALMAAPFDAERLTVTGPAAPMGENVYTRDGRTYFAASATGTLTYLPPADAERHRMVWVDRKGSTTPVVDEYASFVHPRISPDGGRVLVQTGEGGRNEFWIHDIARGTRTRLTLPGAISRPVWTPDGTRITFQQRGDLYSLPVDESTGPELVMARDDTASPLFPLAWSRDGRTLVYSRPSGETNRDVMTLSVGGRPSVFLGTPRDERAAMFSPDGRWIVYAMQEPGRDEEVYAQPFGQPGGRLVVSRGGGIEPVWSPKGNEIFYRSVNGRQMMAVDVDLRAREPLRIGTPRKIFEGPFPAMRGSFWSNYDVTPDGQRFLMVEAADEPGTRINVVSY
jgi:Tol biopolymer transport system component